MYAEEADLLARKTAAYLHELDNAPKSLYISENKAYGYFLQRNITAWFNDGLIKQYQRKNGWIEYKVSECIQAAAERQYPFWKIKLIK